MRWSRRFRGVSVAGVAAAVTLAAPVPAVAPALTLSSTTGPTGGGNPVTASATTAVLAPGSKPVVQFQYYGTSATACRATATEVTQIAAAGTTTTAGALTVDPAAVRQLSPSKVVFTVPSAAYPGNVDGVVSTVNTTGLALADGQSSSKW